MGVGVGSGMPGTMILVGSAVLWLLELRSLCTPAVAAINNNINLENSPYELNVVQSCVFFRCHKHGCISLPPMRSSHKHKGRGKIKEKGEWFSLVLPSSVRLAKGTIPSEEYAFWRSRHQM